MKGTRTNSLKTIPRNSGFTLLEMIVVIGIIALILGAAAAVIGRGGEGAKLQVTVAALQGISSNLEQYRLNGTTYPSQAQGLQALVAKPTTAPIPKRYVPLYDEVPKDAWQGEFKYVFPGSVDPRKPEVISTGPDGQFGNDDDISNQD